ncbi:MAG: CubicO group peptidase (beta-lactamase class C family) [Verrucomicrobiales bacterium]|jgi:CubicO group peptidase (beta-lactamase class C family)
MKLLPFFLLAALLSLAPRAESQDQSQLTAAVQPFVDGSELAGAVMLVANGEKVLEAEAVGWANIEKQEAMKVDSMFWIASQSKPITAAAFMMLVDAGEVNLDDPVEKYLPEFQGQQLLVEKDDEHTLLKRPVHPITIREVLSHTSGLPFKSALEEPTLDLYPLAARVRSYAMTPLQFEPGSKYQYSNAGINTAARILEVVSKMPYEQFLAERLFEPLGMKDTTFWPTEKQAARIATSYKPGPKKMGLEPTTIGQLSYPLSNFFERFPMPAGGLFSTANDGARFYQMLLNGGEMNGTRYLSEAAVKELTSKQTPSSLPSSYGLGFSVGETTFGHGGAYSTNSTADSKSGLIYIWLVQHAGFPGEGAKAQDAFRKAAAQAFGG